MEMATALGNGNYGVTSEYQSGAHERLVQNTQIMGHKSQGNRRPEGHKMKHAEVIREEIQISRT